jgi:hypothetical protein
VRSAIEGWHEQIEQLGNVCRFRSCLKPQTVSDVAGTAKQDLGENGITPGRITGIDIGAAASNGRGEY